MRYEVLEKAFSLQREHESLADAEFAGWLIGYIAKETGQTPSRIDAAGNIIYELGGKTLFAAHIDTVHYSGKRENKFTMKGAKGGKVKRMKNAATVHASGAALGADDGVGVLCLVELICAGVEGSYAFTRGEECGGVGASHLADQWPDWLMQHDRAICFDRRDTHEVIITQGGMSCASVGFGEALSDALNDQGMLYAPSTKGVYTDCREWAHLIPECVNIGAGYWNEHSKQEYVDLNHVRSLVYAIVRIQWNDLPVIRDTSEKMFSLSKASFEIGNQNVIDQDDGFYKAILSAKDHGDTYDLEVELDYFERKNNLQTKFYAARLTKTHLQVAWLMSYRKACEYLLENCREKEPITT